MGSDIYGDLSPTAVLSEMNTVGFNKQEDKVVLTITLPDLDKSLLDIGQKENDLIIKAGNYSRIFSLPDTLVKKEIHAAKYEHDKLKISFCV